MTHNVQEPYVKKLKGILMWNFWMLEHVGIISSYSYSSFLMESQVFVYLHRYRRLRSCVFYIPHTQTQTESKIKEKGKEEEKSIFQFYAFFTFLLFTYLATFGAPFYINPIPSSFREFQDMQSSPLVSRVCTSL